MTLKNGSHLEIRECVKKALPSILNHLHRNYINMGMIEEDNLFLEAEQADENDLNVVMEAAEDNKKPAQPKEQPKEQPKPKAEVPKDSKEQSGGGDDLFSEGGGDEGGDNLFGEAEESGKEAKEEDELDEGLPTDDQYYVVLLKDINRKLIKLNEVSLKLLKKTEENEAKIINKIESLTYVFNRFVEKYTDYEDSKDIVLHLRKVTDSLIKYIDNYLVSKDGKKYRGYLSKYISADTKLKFLVKYCHEQSVDFDR